MRIKKSPQIGQRGYCLSLAPAGLSFHAALIQNRRLDRRQAAVGLTLNAGRHVMRDRVDMGDDSGYSGFIFMMVVLGVPVFLVTVFAMIGILIAN